MDNPVIALPAEAGAKPAKFKGFFSFKKVIAGLVILLVIATSASAAYYFLGKKSLLGIVPSGNQKFELKESSPQDQDGGFGVVGQPILVFSKKVGVEEKDLAKYFNLSPAVEGNWHLEKNGQVVYFSSDKKEEKNLPQTFAYNTVYKVTVDKSLYSSDQQNLPDNLEISFRTKQNPEFNLASSKKLIVGKLNQPVEINVNRIIYDKLEPQSGTFVTVTIQNATELQLLSYFSYDKDNNSPLYQFNSDNETHSNQKVIKVPLQTIKTTNNLQLSLPQDTFSGPGLYHLSLNTEFGFDDLFVVVSNHIHQVFNDSTSTAIWTTDPTSGKSIGGVTVQLYQVKGKPSLVDTIQTGVDGVAKSTKVGSDVDFVITRKDSDIAISFTETYGLNGHVTDVNDEKYTTFSYSDRPVYRPGDKVHYKAVLRKKENGNYVVPSGEVYLNLRTSSDLMEDETTERQKVQIDQNGTVNWDTVLPKMTVGSYPGIILSSKKADGTFDQINNFSVNVESYRKPDMDVSAVGVEAEYISSDSAHMKVFAKTNYGQPLANVDFSYRVLISDYSEIKDRNLESISERVSGYYGQGAELTQGTGKFNKDGTADLTFSATLPSTVKSSQIATLEITPNIGAVPSFSKVAKLIHRGSFALFIDDLSGNVEKGVSGKVTVLNHANPRQAVGDKSLQINLYKITSYDNKRELVTSQNVIAGADGTALFKFDNVASGSYSVEAVGVDERSNSVYTSGQLFVGQPSQYFSSTEKNKIELTSDKDSYSEGDNATITIKSSFIVNDALVAISDEGNNGAHIVSLVSSAIGKDSWNIPLQLKKEYGRALGVDVFVVYQGAIISQHVVLPIEEKNKKLSTKVSFDKQIYKPGEKVTATVQTEDEGGSAVSADTSLSVIDGSILQIGQLSGAIQDSFYGYTPYFWISHYDSTTGIDRGLGGGGGGCFLAGTQILMSDGSTKNIEDVRVGDKIKTRAGDNSAQLVEDTVLNTYKHAVTDYLTINNSLNVTWIHRIFINGSWQEAKDAKIGDTLTDQNGLTVKITSIIPHLGQYQVYNLTTSKYHTFFANGFYVHNDKGEGPRQNFADTAYWNPHIQTDAKGSATVTFALPDNLTTYTAQVVANTKSSQFGQSTAEFIVQKDFNLIPAISHFYYDGDKPVIATLIQNSSAKDNEIDVSLNLKQLGFSKSQKVQVKKGEFGVVTFAVDKGLPKGELSFLIEAKESNGTLVDSLLVKKMILPKGNIVSSWQSFSGSRTVSFSATHPDLDFNTLSLSVIPNVAADLFDSYAYFESQPSEKLGQQLYGYSYIFAQTRAGKIAPTSYEYAKLQNQFRESVDVLLRGFVWDHWSPPQYSQNVSVNGMNLWLTYGLEQAAKNGGLDQIRSISPVTDLVKQFVMANKFTPAPANFSLPPVSSDSAEISRLISTLPPPALLPLPQSKEEIVLRALVLNEQDTSSQESVEMVALRALKGDSSALEKLKTLTIPSASDRFIWDGDNEYASVLPVLAMVEHGSREDAEKAIKGLSLSHYSVSSNILDVVCGVKFADKYNLFIDKPKVAVSINDDEVFVPSDTKTFISFNQDYQMRNVDRGILKAAVSVSGDLPIYTTFVQSDFTDQSSIADKSKQVLGITDQIGQLFKSKSQESHLSGPETALAKEVDFNLVRSLRDTKTGEVIQKLAVGQSGIVILSTDNQFFGSLPQDTYSGKYIYRFKLQDAISPGYLYLNQTGYYGPNYTSVLAKIFPGNNNVIFGSTTPPANYSDEAVFFSSTTGNQNIVLPYSVYRVSEGEYYQPKTSIVFPTLGLISKEK